MRVRLERNMHFVTREMRAVGCLTALWCVTLTGCTSKQTASECGDGSKGTPMITLGGRGVPARSTVIDATDHEVVLLVQYTERESGGLPVPGTQVAVVHVGEELVLVDGDLGAKNRRIESVRRKARTVHLTRGSYFLATGKADGPVEVRRCA